MEENIWVEVLFLIKVHAGGTISTSNCWYTRTFFHCTANNKIKTFCTISKVCSYSRLENLVIVSVANIIFNVESRGVHLQKKKIKIKWDKDLCLISSRYMDFLPQFYAGTDSFYVKKIPTLNNTDFTYYLSYRCKNFILRFKAFTYLSLPISRSSSKFVLISCISKKVCYFCLFICHAREFKKHYRWKFKVFRHNLKNIKKLRNYFPRKGFIDKAIQFNRSFMLWKIPLKLLPQFMES